MPSTLRLSLHTLRALVRARLLTPRGIAALVGTLATVGVNLAALLRVAAQLHPERVALRDGEEALTYAALWQRVEALGASLMAEGALRRGQRVALLCRGHAAAVTALFAVARAGAHVTLLNPEMGHEQLAALVERHAFDLVLYDEAFAPIMARRADARSLSAALARAATKRGQRLPRAGGGRLVVLTGGTTGEPKAIGRAPALLPYLPPFFAFLSIMRLGECRSLYLATPITHGFGVAVLLIGVALGMELHLTPRFDAARGCALIAEHGVEAMTVVPLMLQRMLDHDAAALAPLRLIVSGGAPLSPALAEATLARLGPVLFNLYGSSEAGFSLLATPALLAAKPDAAGRPLPGVRARVAGAPVGGVGRLHIRSAWAAQRGAWIDTGDLARQDPDGDLFLAGRADEMVISGGEKLYPIELERIVARHPEVGAVAVVAIPDAAFGQRLKAVVVRREGAALDEEALLAWLKPRVARYQMPARVEFRDSLPHTSLGKPDRRALSD